MKCRIVYKPDKSVTVIHYAPKSKLTYEQAMDKAMQGALSGLSFDDVENTELPPTREYRNAWEKEKGKPFTINQTKKDQIDAAKNAPTVEDRIKALEEKTK